MAGKKKSGAARERLDEFGRGVVRAAASNQAEAEAAASSPFLYARVRARMAELGQREERERRLATFMTFWRAVPSLALVAVLAFVLSLSVSWNSQPAGASGDYALLDVQEAGFDNVVFADARSLSSDDVLESIMSGDEQEASR